MIKQIKPIAETHYLCPVEGCKRDLGAVSYEEAMAHVNQPVLSGVVPFGFVFRNVSDGKGLVVTTPVDALRTPNCQYLNQRHADDLAVGFFSHCGLTDRLIVLRYGAYEALCVLSGLATGNYSFYTEKDFADLVTCEEKGFKSVRITPVRTTPQLEEALARMRTEKK